LAWDGRVAAIVGRNRFIAPLWSWVAQCASLIVPTPVGPSGRFEEAAASIEAVRGAMESGAVILPWRHIH
jgi:hypothetical protein